MRTLKRRRPKGFTLLELVIALTLSTFVLVGIVTVSASVIRQQYDAIRGGEVTVATLASLDFMMRELESASHIEPGFPSAAGTDVLKGCVNWSRYMNANAGGALSAADPTSYFVYCVRSDGADPKDGIALFSLIRYTGNGCANPLPTPETSCGTAGSFDTIVYHNFSHADGLAYTFIRDATDSRVRVQYIVGKSTASTNVPNPSFYKGSFAIEPDRAYYNITND